MSAQFGFHVSYSTDGGDMGDTAGWNVSLPHQCDRWDIAGSAYYPLPQDEAVAGLERFLAEGQAALAALREGQPFGREES